MIQRFLGWGVGSLGQESHQDLINRFKTWCTRFNHYLDVSGESASRAHTFAAAHGKEELGADGFTRIVFASRNDSERYGHWVREWLRDGDRTTAAQLELDKAILELKRRGCQYNIKDCSVVCPTAPVGPIGPRPLPLGPSVPAPRPGYFDPLRGGWVHGEPPEGWAQGRPPAVRPPTPTPGGWDPRLPHPILRKVLTPSSSPQTSPGYFPLTTPTVPGTFVPEKGGWVPTPGPQGRVPGPPQTPTPGWGGGVPAATAGGLPLSPLTGAAFTLGGSAFRPGGLAAPALAAPAPEGVLDSPLVRVATDAGAVVIGSLLAYGAAKKKEMAARPLFLWGGIGLAVLGLVRGLYHLTEDL